MDISLLFAKILGVYLVVSGLFLLFRGKTVPNLLKDFFGHPAIVYLSGAVLIFFSTFFLIQKNIWNGTWHTVVTVIAWAALIKGVMYILAPDALHRLASKKMLGSVSIFGLIAVIAGVYLFYIR